MSTLLKMQKFHPLCSRCIGMYPLQNRWTVLRYLQCYENFSECCTHLILPETALFSPTPTFAKEPQKISRFLIIILSIFACIMFFFMRNIAITIALTLLSVSMLMVVSLIKPKEMKKSEQDQ